MPQKTKWSLELQEKIGRLVTAGAPIPAACQASGVSFNTVQGWMKRGKQGEQPYVQFVDEMQKAKSAFIAASVLRITKAADKDWKAAAWLLERRYPEQFAQRTKMEAKLEHRGQVPIQVYLPDNGRARSDDDAGT